MRTDTETANCHQYRLDPLVSVPGRWSPMPSSPSRRAALPRYEEIARRYAAAIEAGTLAPGDRFPSVRQLAAEEDASISTVLATVAELEALGLIEARPRSGHFVR